jgi:hypothetical protein
MNGNMGRGTWGTLRTFPYSLTCTSKIKKEVCNEGYSNKSPKSPKSPYFLVKIMGNNEKVLSTVPQVPLLVLGSWLS